MSGLNGWAPRVAAIADLAVGIGANVQPGQVVTISAEMGHEPIARATAAAAYKLGAKFVDVSYFDPHVKRARLMHAPRESLSFVPRWIGERILAIGEDGGARISFQGPVEPHLFDDVDPELLGIDLLPRTRESIAVTARQQTNWCIVPFPTPAWAAMVHPELEPGPAYDLLWHQIERILRLEDPDPVAAWRERIIQLEGVSSRLNELKLDHLRYSGPGTDLTVGLFPTSRWMSGKMSSIHGIEFTANIPTEETFTAPDPMRLDGVVTATKPLMIPGAAPIEGLRVRFEGGRAVQIDAERGAEILRSMCAKDEGAARIGEVALVDRESRIGQSGSVFYSILLDENASSHLALGNAYPFSVDEGPDRERANQSAIHVDFMVGSSDVDVTGVTADGAEVPLLREGAWQI
ncbi:MAG TPA: aminopeptidase [Solirubrobacteraceae bacterium]|nr:aminopeptidase [Solirubrobacteraceae bacterium]